MATVHGECGAYLDARSIAEHLGLECPPELLFRIDDEEHRARELLRDAVARSIEQLRSELKRLGPHRSEFEERMRRESMAMEAGMRLRVEDLDRKIDRRRRTRRGCRAVLAAPGTLRLMLKRAVLTRIRPTPEPETARTYRKIRDRHDYLVRAPQDEVRLLTKREAHRVAALVQLRRRPECAGAIAELTVAEELAKLPDGFHVFHDVRLRTDLFLRDDNHVPLQSAQIDHVVVGPTGVFVIETKNWTGDFARSRDRFDPHDQVARANRLCWVLLKEAGLERTIRSVIVCCGYQIPLKHGSFARVLRTDRLLRHVRRFPADVDDATLERLVRFFDSTQARQRSARQGSGAR